MFLFFNFVGLCRNYFVWFDSTQTHPIFVVSLKARFSFLHIQADVWNLWYVQDMWGQPVDRTPHEAMDGAPQSLHHRQIPEFLDSVLIESDIATYALQKAIKK